MLLSDDHRACRTRCATSCRAHRSRRTPRAGTASHFPAVELKGLAALGCLRRGVPEQWGGAGLDYLALAIILGRSPPATAAPAPPSASTTARCSILMAWGNEAQKAQWLTPLARGECWAPSA